MVSETLGKKKFHQTRRKNSVKTDNTKKFLFMTEFLQTTSNYQTDKKEYAINCVFLSMEHI